MGREDEELREQLRAVLKRWSLNVAIAGTKSFLRGLASEHKALTSQASTDLRTGTWLEITLSCFSAPGSRRSLTQLPARGSLVTVNTRPPWSENQGAARES